MRDGQVVILGVQSVSSYRSRQEDNKIYAQPVSSPQTPDFLLLSRLRGCFLTLPATTRFADAFMHELGYRDLLLRPAGVPPLTRLARSNRADGEVLRRRISLKLVRSMLLSHAR